MVGCRLPARTLHKEKHRGALHTPRTPARCLSAALGPGGGHTGRPPLSQGSSAPRGSAGLQGPWGGRSGASPAPGCPLLCFVTLSLPSTHPSTQGITAVSEQDRTPPSALLQAPHRTPKPGAGLCTLRAPSRISPPAPPVSTGAGTSLSSPAPKTKPHCNSANQSCSHQIPFSSPEGPEVGTQTSTHPPLQPVSALAAHSPGSQEPAAHLHPSTQPGEDWGLWGCLPEEPSALPQVIIASCPGD